MNWSPCTLRNSINFRKKVKRKKKNQDRRNILRKKKKNLTKRKSTRKRKKMIDTVIFVYWQIISFLLIFNNFNWIILFSFLAWLPQISFPFSHSKSNVQLKLLLLMRPHILQYPFGQLKSNQKWPQSGQSLPTDVQMLCGLDYSYFSEKQPLHQHVEELSNWQIRFLTLIYWLPPITWPFFMVGHSLKCEI